ncbi:putative bifunctional diguanylate cyclase/phosphodiesterase [Vibrio mangrovi]|uniref:Bifunctional diguanylate cyclase/phosphodiesterase n=1 Tax=Vibrio mangrovi TaxID=474394 RepID=A0A1Y6J1W6_9VIBR|nr:bifunctional diguanylate cyclase/phosphodiesterase [Vibrio mangrovi]MDW6004417.1 bifunctional diguanylate cyclase/phosphodiesterase [Vibrio mangrovi]SMS03090.1 Cyclic di-GMP phosphodiesterase Gmr [Vibrio mangrovi]
MVMKYIALASVATGIFLLIYSMKPAYLICRTEKAPGWKILVALIAVFILGYLFVLTELLIESPIHTHLFTVSLILLGGGIFVALIVPLALNTIRQAHRFAKDEQHSSLHDSLTSLANRKYLLQSLKTWVQSKQTFSLLLIDLNNFKQINDGLGHYFGDKFLISVAKLLQENTRNHGQLYRMGGDEFAIIFPDDDDTKILSLVECIHHALHAPVQVMTYSMKTSASIGITKFPHNGYEVFNLLKQADLAMYESKKKHKRYTFYHDQLGSNSYGKLKLSIKLSEALKNDEFELHYQPIIQGQTQKVSSLEVLLRWPQEDGSFIEPEDFIPIAEKSALISVLTQWVIHRAAQDLNVLRAHGFQGSLHINLSAKDFQDDEVTEQLHNLLNSGQIQPADFVFEITESAVFEDIDKAKRVIHEMHALGFRFSIDDFGTGYSSLIILRELPVKQIKIDRSFIIEYHQKEANRTIVYALIRLAQDLNLSVVAEGVEAGSVEQALIKLGCNYIQGFLYFRPEPLHRLLYNEQFRNHLKPESPQHFVE